MLDDYTFTEFQESKQLLLEKILKYSQPFQNSQAVLIVGQPGAGKTTLANLFQDNIYLLGLNRFLIPFHD